LRDFASTHFAERFLQDTPVDKVVDHFQEMKSESGGIDVALVLKPEMAGQANLLLRTRTGHHFVRIVAFEDGGRITDFFLLTATNPQGISPTTGRKKRSLRPIFTLKSSATPLSRLLATCFLASYW